VGGGEKRECRRGLINQTRVQFSFNIAFFHRIFLQKDYMLRKIRIFILLTATMAFSILFSAKLFAAGGRISGQVLKAITKRPLAGVKVGLFQKFKPILKITKANLEGKFKTFEVPPGIYDVEFTLEGYSNLLIKDIVVKANQNSTIKDLLMRKETKEGDTIVLPIRNDTSKVKK